MPTSLLDLFRVLSSFEPPRRSLTPHTWSLHLQAHDNLLLAVNGVNIYGAELGIEKEKY